MRYHSTKQDKIFSPLSEAVIKGLPDDNGLFVPESIATLPRTLFDPKHGIGLEEWGMAVMKPYFTPDIPESVLQTIIEDTLNFSIPLIEVERNVYSLELFHGPTLAFKDVGARFMARVLNYLSSRSKERTIVLVATSGDTGSAVAHGFFDMDNIEVVILYPSGKVSPLQEQQMTTLGKNIHALEVAGNFDDCQRMVKEAFLDQALNKKLQLTSANSINIARFLPQSVYYFHALAQLGFPENAVISVPSGNYGNLTAGLTGYLMGMPVEKFVASSNVNDIVPHYLATGEFSIKPSISTISNAMDVGNPSNFSRIDHFFKHDLEKMRRIMAGFSFDDDSTRAAIKEVYQSFDYMLDPHGAVAYLGLKKYMDKHPGKTGIFLETAHPAKFKDTVEEVLNTKLEIPEQLSVGMNKPKQTTLIGSNFSELKDFLLR
ncbi:MAG: threonine synthase [Cyclobacteriaceae bacterium]|nr:threonine synthase [Cyclobacteriaceae bacterium]